MVNISLLNVLLVDLVDIAAIVRHQVDVERVKDPINAFFSALQQLET